eukprot:14575636-Ditylum_brightwellii.AAC.1
MMQHPEVFHQYDIDINLTNRVALIQDLTDITPNASNKDIDDINEAHNTELPDIEGQSSCHLQGKTQTFALTTHTLPLHSNTA